MPFIPDIPKPTDIISQSQQDLRNNTNAVQTAFEVDHGDFNSALEGQHEKVTLPNAAAPVFPNPATDIGFYNANGVTSGVAEGYVHKHIAGPAQIEVPFTESILGTTAAPLAASSGWTYLPSGILMKWGNAVTINGTQLVNVNAGGDLGPNFTSLFHVVITPRNLFVGTITVTLPGLPNFGLVATDAGNNVSFLAIGRGV
jgi:hypothetical protein